VAVRSRWWSIGSYAAFLHSLSARRSMIVTTPNKLGDPFSAVRAVPTTANVWNGRLAVLLVLRSFWEAWKSDG
jgi:hypothetical protein